ncbi:MAG: MXAN_2562 family outer membrane beta-barrel protein [Sandaracinaceae bacterium]
MTRLLLCFAALLAVSTTAVTARADFDDWTAVPEYTGSPEHFGLELRVGAYYPTGLGDLFTSSDYFGSDIGPDLSFELHYFPFRIDYIGLLGIGGGLGWSQWDTESPGGTANVDRNSFEILNMRALLLWRFDTLARELNVPLVLTPKFGLDVGYWQTALGSESPEDGWSIGPRFAGKVSLELDFLEPRAARQLDEEWGINHSEIFAEFHYSMAGEPAGGQLPINGWGWTLGLGFTF